MSELMNRVSCPNGCTNPIFTESTRTLVEQNSKLLNESAHSAPATKKIKVYNCSCCGNTFEIYQNNKNRLLI